MGYHAISHMLVRCYFGASPDFACVVIYERGGTQAMPCAITVLAAAHSKVRIELHQLKSPSDPAHITFFLQNL